MTRKVAQQPVLVAVVEIIQYLREKGSASPSELIANVKAKKRTYYRALESLQEAEVVIKRDDGNFFWYEFIETRVFQNEFEAEEALNHSRNIAKGLRFLMGEEKRYFKEEDVNVDRGYLDFGIMHLNTGYPEIRRDYHQAESARKEMHDVEMRVIKRITEGILPSHHVLYPDHLAHIIIEDIKDSLTGRTPSFLEGLRIDGDEVRSIGYTLASKDAFEELKDFIIKQEENKENREDCGYIIELGTGYYKLRQSLQKEISILIRMVENGTPLQGRCKICPKIKIVQACAPSTS